MDRKIEYITPFVVNLTEPQQQYNFNIFFQVQAIILQTEMQPN